jgi:hypothetical protein
VKPTPAAVTGDWTGHLVFLGRPNVSLLNQANPALFRVSFREEQGRIAAAFRLGPGAGDLSPEFQHRGEPVLDEVRMLDDRTLLGRWMMPDIAPGLFLGLQDFIETGRGRPVFYWVLTR